MTKSREVEDPRSDAAVLATSTVDRGGAAAREKRKEPPAGATKDTGKSKSMLDPETTTKMKQFSARLDALKRPAPRRLGFCFMIFEHFVCKKLIL